MDGEIGQLNITGALHPPSTNAQIIAQITSFAWIGGLALAFGGAQIFKMLGMNEPELYRKVKENQTMFLLSLFILNSVGNSGLSTGAFEIFVDDKLVFSKLATGRTPGPEDIESIMALLRGR